MRRPIALLLLSPRLDANYARIKADTYSGPKKKSENPATAETSNSVQVLLLAGLACVSLGIRVVW